MQKLKYVTMTVSPNGKSLLKVEGANLQISNSSFYPNTGNLVVGKSNLYDEASNSFIVGSFHKAYSDSNSLVGGGYNQVKGAQSVINGGLFNNISSSRLEEANLRCTINGGELNIISTGVHSTITGGQQNKIGMYVSKEIFNFNGNPIEIHLYHSSQNSSIVGGKQNFMDLGDSSSINGGYRNKISHSLNNSIPTDNSIKCSVINSGEDNRLLGRTHDSTINGGSYNQISRSRSSVVLGGRDHFLDIFGGSGGDRIEFALVVGGEGHILSSSKYAVFLGGRLNTLNWLLGSTTETVSDIFFHTHIFGGGGNVLGGPQPNNHNSGGIFNMILGGSNNQLARGRGTNDSKINNNIVGGVQNKIFSGSGVFGSHGGIFGGRDNTVTEASYAFVCGGSGIFTNTSEQTLFCQ